MTVRPPSRTKAGRAKQFLVALLSAALAWSAAWLVALGIWYIAMALGLGPPVPNIVVLIVMFYPVALQFTHKHIWERFCGPTGDVEDAKIDYLRQHAGVPREITTPAPGQLILARTHAYMDRLWIYRVYIDGAPVEPIADGETIPYDLAPGHHEISVRIGRRETRPVRFSIDLGETKHLCCGTNLNGVKVLIFPWYLTFGKNDCLWLR